MFIAVVDWTPEGRVKKYQGFESEADALSHLEGVREKYPNSFVAPDPGGNFSGWQADGSSLVWTLPDGVLEETKRAVKEEAKRRILAVYPDWKQRNMTALAVTLVRAVADGAVLTPEQQAEISALESVWAWVTQVRSASDSLEASLDGMTDAELAAFEPSAARHWPANP